MSHNLDDSVSKIEHMQTFSGTQIWLVHMPFDRACDSDQEYNCPVSWNPFFPYKNCKIPSEARRPEKMGASRKSLTSPLDNIGERRGFDFRIQKKNLH